MRTHLLYHCTTLLWQPVADGTGPTLRDSLAQRASCYPWGATASPAQGFPRCETTASACGRSPRYQGLQARPSGVRAISMPGNIRRTGARPHGTAKGEGGHHPWPFCSTVVEISHHRVPDGRRATGRRCLNRCPALSTLAWSRRALTRTEGMVSTAAMSAQAEPPAWRHGFAILKQISFACTVSSPDTGCPPARA